MTSAASLLLTPHEMPTRIDSPLYSPDPVPYMKTHSPGPWKYGCDEHKVESYLRVAYVTNRKPISVSATTLGDNEYQYLIHCLNTQWFSQGHYVREFESRFADYIGVKHALTCSSGTAALHLAMLALGVGPSDAVIIPALTYVATANAARYCGARVEFVDIDQDSWCMDHLQSVKRSYDLWELEKVNSYTVPVHLYDAVCAVPCSSRKTDPEEADPDKWEYVKEPGGHVIEDTCHAPGVDSYGRRLGAWGAVGCFSFYASKHISCGEGGMITTNDDELASRIRLYRGQGATTPGTYHHSVIGYNYRMTDLQAAVGLAQLETLDERIRYRRQVIDRYRERLGANSKITLQGGERASGWMFACLLPSGTYYESVKGRLLDLDIETRPFFEPLNSLPIYGSDSSSTPIASEVSRRGICLPTHCEIDDADVDYICDSLEEVLG